MHSHLPCIPSATWCYARSNRHSWHMLPMGCDDEPLLRAAFYDDVAAGGRGEKRGCAARDFMQSRYAEMRRLLCSRDRTDVSSVRSWVRSHTRGR
jgi:hypothetical protein